MPREITHSNGATTDLYYDGMGSRVKKSVDSGGSTVDAYYIGDHLEVRGGMAQKYIFAGNLRIAQIVGVSNDSEATIYIHLVIEGEPLPLMKINQGLEQVPDSEPIKRRIVTEKDVYERARAQYYIYEALQAVIPTPKALKLVTSVFLSHLDFTYIETKFLVETRVYVKQPDGSYAYHGYARYANDFIDVWTTIEGPKAVIYKPGL